MNRAQSANRESERVVRVEEGRPAVRIERWRWWLWTALSLSFLRILPELRYPLGRDEATYSLIGQGLLHRQVLYRDLWDNKPPGIFFIYAGIVRIFGHVMWSAAVVDILWLLGLSICIFCFARRYLGAPAAAIAVVVNALWHCSWGYIHAAQPDDFLTLFVFLAYFLLTSKWAQRWWGNVACGLLCGAAFWLKYNAATFFPLLVFLPYLDFSGFDLNPRRVRLSIPWRRWSARTLWIVAGFLLSVGVVLLYFWHAGGLPALREVQFTVLPRYGSMFLQRKRRYWFFALVLIRLHLGTWTEAVFGAALLIAWGRRELRVIAPVVLMALAGFACTASQFRFSSYYFETAYPFFAMLWGYVIFRGFAGLMELQRYLRQRGVRFAGALLWIVAAQVAYLPVPDMAYRIREEYKELSDWIRHPQQFYWRYPFPHLLDKFPGQLAIIDFLKTPSAQSGAVFVWGTAPLINFATQRPNPTRFVSNFALISPWGPQAWRQELIGELDRRPPSYIVVARHDAIPDVTLTYDDSEQRLWKYPALASFITHRYESVKNLDDFQVYSLKRP